MSSERNLGLLFRLRLPHNCLHHVVQPAETRADQFKLAFLRLVLSILAILILSRFR